MISFSTQNDISETDVSPKAAPCTTQAKSFQTTLAEKLNVQDLSELELVRYDPEEDANGEDEENTMLQEELDLLEQ